MGQQAKAGNGFERLSLRQFRLNGVNGPIAGADEKVGHAIPGKFIKETRQLFKSLDDAC